MFSALRRLAHVDASARLYGAEGAPEGEKSQPRGPARR
ncbi:hypothetical protein HDA41_004241 [Streptomyces caelestis]|uniref:Uncharacterized protein n=1 Tax=Streptomyces caelestis TaxID=36816 RepID=A0A7W9H5Y3_9ACTN|nr:hypothetical protein [Streptomyces caelestis]